MVFLYFSLVLLVLSFGPSCLHFGPLQSCSGSSSSGPYCPMQSQRSMVLLVCTLGLIYGPLFLLLCPCVLFLWSRRCYSPLLLKSGPLVLVFVVPFFCFIILWFFISRVFQSGQWSFFLFLCSPNIWSVLWFSFYFKLELNYNDFTARFQCRLWF